MRYIGTKKLNYENIITALLLPITYSRSFFYVKERIQYINMLHIQLDILYSS